MKIFNMKNLVITLLVLSMIFGLFACDVSKETEDGSAPDSDAQIDESNNDTVVTDAPETYLDIVVDGVSVNVVYAATASSTEIDAANELANKILRITGARVTVTSERLHNANTVEILVGGVGYPESKELRATLGYGESAIKVIGNKLVIVSTGESMLSDAIGVLATYFNSVKDKNQNLRIPTSYEKRIASNEVLAALPFYGEYSPEVTDTGDGCYKLDFTNETVFRDYINILKAKGFKLYHQNIIENNEYYTYTNDELVVTAIHTDYNSKSKLLVQELKDTALPTRAEDNKYTPIKGLATTITQVGLFYDVQTDSDGCMTNFNGMCYVIRLADGRFIVVDGGHGKVQADNIYKTLVTQAHDPDNIVIAAWFISHNHNDHNGFLDYFLNAYYKKVKIESFVTNFPGAEQSGYVSSTDATRNRIRGLFPDCKYIKAHPGQEFNIADVKITMLYTMDVCENSTIANWDTNNASLVWQAEFSDGTTFMCLGDYSENGATLMSLYTQKTLKSDIVQIAHHGISGQTKAIYEKIVPEYAFWPVGAWRVKFCSNGNHPDLTLNDMSNSMIKNRNEYFFTKMDSNKIYLAADDLYVMKIANGSVSVDKYDDIDTFVVNYKNP